jgi:ankyrin repeat protein
LTKFVDLRNDPIQTCKNTQPCTLFTKHFNTKWWPKLIQQNQLQANTTALQLLKSCHQLVNDPDSDGRRPIHLAISSSGTDMVAQLLEMGADINFRDDLGRSVLHFAVVHENLEALKLLKSCHHINEVDAEGNCPLHSAIVGSTAAGLLSQLLEMGAQVNARQAAKGVSALHLAASHGRVSAMECLTSHGANVDQGPML